jgi:hypothetical protein
MARPRAVEQMVLADYNLERAKEVQANQMITVFQWVRGHGRK